METRAAKNQAVRGELLYYLTTVYPYGAGLSLIQRELDFLGYSRAAEEIDDHVAYLEERGFVVVEEIPGRDPRRRVRLVRLTDLGVDYYNGRLPVDPGVYVERT